MLGALSRKLNKMYIRLELDHVNLKRFNEKFSNSNDISAMDVRVMFDPKTDDYAKVMTAKKMAFMMGVLREIDPNKYPEIRVLTDLEILKTYISSIAQLDQDEFKVIPLLYSDKFSSSHFSALSICLQNSKINFLYFDSVGMECNVKAFFEAWNFSVPEERRGVFAGYCPNSVFRVMQKDMTSCSFFATKYLLKSAKCKSLDESLELLGYRKSGDGFKARLSTNSDIIREIFSLQSNPESLHYFSGELCSFLQTTSSPLTSLSPKILKYAQTNLSALKDLEMPQKMQKFLREHTYNVADMDDDGEWIVKKHNRAIIDFKRDVFKLCVKYLNENQVDEELIVAEYLNNSDYISGRE